MIKRELQDELLESSKEYPIVTVIGPRQSGKTTLVKHCFPDYCYVNLENPEIRHLAESDPKAFLYRFQPPAIFDEIQNVPSLLSWLQLRVDESSSRDSQYILTGSHQLQLRESITQSLAGRTALLTLLPFSMNELKNKVSMSNRTSLILDGFMPGLIDRSIRRSRFFRDYYLTYVERDVRKLIAIENQNAFELLLRLLASRTGQEINYSELSNQVGISSPQIKKWISVLEASFIIFKLPPFHTNFGKRLTKSPKIYFVDVGLAVYLLGIETDEQLERDRAFGGLFENLIISDMLKERLNSGKDPNLYFFRDRYQHEVDVLYPEGSDHRHIEIKSSQTYKVDMLKGIKYFAKLSESKNKGILLYDGDLEFSTEDAEIYNFRNWRRLIR